MAEHSIKESMASVAEYIGEAVAEKEDIFQYSTMPEAGEDFNNKIIQYTGNSIVNSYQNGLFYKCVKVGADYEWQNINTTDLSEKEDKFRLTTMPEPSAEYANEKTYQYIGPSISGSFQHNFFYECRAQVTDPVTYAWENVKTQASGGGADGISSENIKSARVVFDSSTYEPIHLYFNVEYSLKPFEDASWNEIMEIVDGYYSGEYSLEDIIDDWGVGSNKNITFNAMTGGYGSANESHAQQTANVCIVGINHNTLTTSINGKTKALFTFQMSNCFNELGKYHTTYSSAFIPWSTSNRRSWCNDTCYNAIQSDIKAKIKEVDRIVKDDNVGSTTTVSDKVFIPTAKEMANYGDDGGTMYEYYDLAEHRIKKVNGTASSYYTSTSEANNIERIINTVGNIDRTPASTYTNTPLGISVAFCL